MRTTRSSCHEQAVASWTRTAQSFYDGLMSSGSKDLKLTPGDVVGMARSRARVVPPMMNGNVPDRERNAVSSSATWAELEKSSTELEQRSATTIGS